MRVRDLLARPSEQRLRAPWRLGLHAMACAGASFGVAMVARAVPELGSSAAWTAALVIVAAVTLAFGARVDRREGWPRTLGLHRRGFTDAGAGAVLGAGLIGGILAFEVALGVSSVRPASGAIDPSAFAGGLTLFGAIAVSEELVFRAYHLTNLAEGLTRGAETRARAVAAALGLACVVFGLAHAGNPNATILGVVNVTLAGALLGVPFVVTGRLGFSIGLHFAWNLGQSLLDMPVSGQRVGVTLIERTGTGADWVTGGAFGPEGGPSGSVPSF